MWLCSTMGLVHTKRVAAIPSREKARPNYAGGQVVKGIDLLQERERQMRTPVGNGTGTDEGGYLQCLGTRRGKKKSIKNPNQILGQGGRGTREVLLEKS